MKAITFTLILGFISSTVYSQLTTKSIENRHSFEIEALGNIQFSSSNHTRHSLGMGISYRSLINSSLSLRHSLRYYKGRDDLREYGAGLHYYSLLQYAGSLVYSFGANKNWETSIGITTNRRLSHNNSDNYIPSLDFKNSIGLQFGLGKIIEFDQHKINLGIQTTYDSEDGIYGGLRLGYILR